MASDWIKFKIYDNYFENMLIKKETEKALLLKFSNNYLCWITKKLYKTNSSRTVKYLIFKPSMRFKIFKNRKNINEKWEKYNEKEIGYKEFHRLLKMSEEAVDFIALSKKERHYRTKDQKKVKIILYNQNFEYNYCFISVDRCVFKKETYIYFYPRDKVSIYDYNFNFKKEIRFDEIKKLLEESQKIRTSLFLSIPDKIIFDKNKNYTEESLKDIKFKYNINNNLLQTKTKLYDFQSKAVAKLLQVTTGALFMDMGTGKTRVALELIKYRQNRISKAVWVTPVSLKFNTFMEIQKHTTVKSNEIYRFDNKTDDSNIPKAFMYIVGIESISMSDRVMLALHKIIDENTYLIIDESSKIRRYSQQTQRLIKLGKNLKYKLILTGTPISEGIIDLYNPFYFLSPKILGYKNFYAFARNHLEYSTKEPHFVIREHNEDYIMHKIKPYTYQIKKEDVLSLPKKHYINKYFFMSNEQDEQYEQIKNEILDNIENEEEHTSTSIFRLFTVLQQIVCGYYNYKNEMEVFDDNPRIKLFEETINEIDEDEKIVIFTKYKFDIKEITKLLDKKYKETSYVLYTGDEDEKEKEEAIFSFKNDDNIRFFIATFGSAAYGLTLTNSRFCIFYNNTYKHIERVQAEDRLHRIGQISTVDYISLYCSYSIDMKILYALENKKDVSELFSKELDEIKDKDLKKSLIRAIISGNMQKAEKIIEESKKSLSAAKRMEKMRRKRGVIPRDEYLEKSISRQKPWEKISVSRAMWYRKYRSQYKKQRYYQRTYKS